MSALDWCLWGEGHAWNWLSHYDDDAIISHNIENRNISSLRARSPLKGYRKTSCASGTGEPFLSHTRGGLATVFKKSVNHSRTVASMRETGEQQQKREVRLRSDSTVWSEFAFGPVGPCFLCCNQFLSAVMWSLRIPFFWSCVCHYMRFITVITRPVNIDRKQTLSLNAGPFDSLHLSRCSLSSCVYV